MVHLLHDIIAKIAVRRVTNSHLFIWSREQPWVDLNRFSILGPRLKPLILWCCSSVYWSKLYCRFNIVSIGREHWNIRLEYPSFQMGEREMRHCDGGLNKSFLIKMSLPIVIQTFCGSSLCHPLRCNKIQLSNFHAMKPLRCQYFLFNC